MDWVSLIATRLHLFSGLLVYRNSAKILSREMDENQLNFSFLLSLLKCIVLWETTFLLLYLLNFARRWEDEQMNPDEISDLLGVHPVTWL